MLPAVLAACGIGVVTFTATNIDDIFILLAFFADPAHRARHVVIGQFLGISVLVIASLLLAFGATLLPPTYVGLLGLLPMAIGVKKLIELRRDDNDAEGARSTTGAAVLSVAAVTIANGGDNLGVYVPLFSTRSAAELIAIVSIFALMTGVWCGVGYGLVSHPAIGPRIRRPARVLVPFVLIAIGVFILVDSKAYTIVVR